jgi:DDE superfamily endonuclease
VPETVIVASFLSLLQVFSRCFTSPSLQTFQVLASGWVHTLGRHTVTATVRSANAVGWKHISSFHRFFSKARWATDQVGLVVVRLVDALVDKSEPLVVPIDDTLGRHTGKQIAAASMHRDPLLSTGKLVYFHWGHLWVVAGINLRAFGKTWCLPVLFRLYRGKKRCLAEKRTYRKTTQLAAELIALLAGTLPHRQIMVVGDAAYTNHATMKRRPANVTLIGRCRLDAALYRPAPVRRAKQMGRPRVRGARLPSPGALAERTKTRWQRVQVQVYGELVRVRVLVIDALWYVAAGSELVRLVVVRDFPGHDKDDVFVCTDPSLDTKPIIETFSNRWALEVTFQETKGKLGLEDPQNRTERAVERTAPLALWLYTLVVIWYVGVGNRLRVAKTQMLPWYRQKAGPAFSDMLATLRRASWAERLVNPCAANPTLRKALAPLLHYLEAAA